MTAMQAVFCRHVITTGTFLPNIITLRGCSSNNNEEEYYISLLPGHTPRFYLQKEKYILCLMQCRQMMT